MLTKSDGLGDYDRNSGYVGGSVTLTNETVKNLLYGSGMRWVRGGFSHTVPNA